MIQAHCVAPHAREPPQLPKHVKFEPSDAQSELTVHALEHAFARLVQPASVTADRARHESPAAQSESALQEVPADLSGELLQAKRTMSRPVAMNVRIETKPPLDMTNSWIRVPRASGGQA